MIAVNAHYDGTHIICDENVKMQAGQQLIVTILENACDTTQKAMAQTDAIIQEIQSGKRIPYNSWEDAKASLMQ